MTYPYRLFYPTTMKSFNEYIFDNGIGEKDTEISVKVYSSKLRAIDIAENFNEDAVVIEIDAKKMVNDGCTIISNSNNWYLTEYIDPKYFMGQYNIHINDKKVEEI